MADIVFVTWGLYPTFLDVLENIIKHIPDCLILNSVPSINEVCKKKNYNFLYSNNINDKELREAMLQSKVLVAPDFCDVTDLKEKGIICAQTFHGIVGKNWSYTHPNVPQWDVFLMAGEYSRKRLQDYYKISDDRIFKIGSPKLDCLFDGSLDREAILKDIGLSPKNKTVFYCPTHSELSSEEEMLNYLEELDDLGVNIVIKLHDAAKFRPQYAEMTKKLNNTVLVNDYRIAPYLFVGDILVSDCSSSAYDFLPLNRPIIFVKDNEAVEHWRNALVDDSEIEISYRNVGERINDFTLLSKVITDCLDNPDRREEERLRVRDEILTYYDGKAGRRAADILLDLLKKEG